MSELPEKLWLRRGEVREYLGISEQAMTKLIESGTLKEKFFPGMVRAYFERSQVLAVKPEEKNQPNRKENKL
jgi:hypothetical protein